MRQQTQDIHWYLIGFVLLEMVILIIFSHSLEKSIASLLLLLVFIVLYSGRQHRKAWLKSQNYAQNVIESSLDMIITVDLERRIVEFNKAAQDTFGYRKHEVLGKDVGLLYAEKQQALLVSQTVREQGYCIKEVANVRKTGELFQCLLSASILRDPQSRPIGVMGVSRDITEQKRSEEHLRHLNQQLQQANRLKSEFLASMSHELRTPLNAMIGYTSLTLNALRNELSSEHLQNLIKAEQSARVLLQLINDVLDFSKIEAGRLEIFIEEIDPIDILEDVSTSTVGLLSDKPEELREELPDDLPVIETDYTRLKQILRNLASNAVKFTREGFVAIRAQNLTEQELLRIEVEDTGSGIPKENADYIFALFRQADGSIKKNFGGTGLGLAVTKRLCDMLHIEIGFETVIGQGTTFWLHVPWHFSVEEPETSESAPPAIDTKALVLCLSMPEAKTLLSPHLAGLPLEIREIDSIAEASAICESEPVWTLLVPPDRTGFEACQHFSRDMPDRLMPVMMCSVAETGPYVCVAPVSWVSTSAAADLFPERDTSQAVLLDLNKPDLDDFRQLQEMQGQQTGRRAPVMFISSDPVSEHEWEQFEAGMKQIGSQEQRGGPESLSWSKWIARWIPYIGIRSVLVVDDNDMNVSLMTNVLEKSGYQVHTAQSGLAAIETARTTIPGTILMDLAMPGMDGLEATREIKQYPETRDIPIIACSAFATQDDQTKAYQEGCEGYITKPIEPTRLVEQIEKYVIRSRISRKMKQRM